MCEHVGCPYSVIAKVKHAYGRIIWCTDRQRGVEPEMWGGAGWIFLRWREVRMGCRSPDAMSETVGEWHGPQAGKQGS